MSVSAELGDMAPDNTSHRAHRAWLPIAFGPVGFILGIGFWAWAEHGMSHSGLAVLLEAAIILALWDAAPLIGLAFGLAITRAERHSPFSSPYVITAAAELGLLFALPALLGAAVIVLDLLDLLG